MAPVPLVYDKENEPFQNSEELANGWVDFFAAVEGGARVGLDHPAKEVLTELQRIAGSQRSRITALRHLLSL